MAIAAVYGCNDPRVEKTGGGFTLLVHIKEKRETKRIAFSSLGYHGNVDPVVDRSFGTNGKPNL
eukprot:scaffold1381_cov64-Cylindrotheca_fusiformis.AAC.14